DDRLRAPPQPCASARLRGRVRAGADQRHPTGVGAAGGDCAGQPQRPPDRQGFVSAQPRLGLRENLAQFSLLVAITAFVGAMVGLERSTLPLIGREDFGLSSSAAVLTFIVAFGLAKALTNLGACALALRAGRRRLLIGGWMVALPVPLMIALAPSWGWIVAANALPGMHQGLSR